MIKLIYGLQPHFYLSSNVTRNYRNAKKGKTTLYFAVKKYKVCISFSCKLNMITKEKTLEMMSKERVKFFRKKKIIQNLGFLQGSSVSAILTAAQKMSKKKEAKSS